MHNKSNEKVVMTTFEGLEEMAKVKERGGGVGGGGLLLRQGRDGEDGRVDIGESEIAKCQVGAILRVENE